MPTSARTFLLVLALCALMVPAAHANGDGTTGGTAATNAGGAPAAADGQVVLVARTDHLLGRTVRFSGRAGGAPAGEAVTIERFDPKASTWTVVTQTVTQEGGAFTGRWRANHIGRFRFRARTAESTSASARASQSSLELALTVYRPSVATWYGPGFYGRRTACGQRMSRRLLGVAHKTLPCGTQVALLHAGRTITVPVVDRGPFRRGTDWDLTSATARALAFTATGTLGAVTVR